jgi:hypothetical protein
VPPLAVPLASPAAPWMEAEGSVKPRLLDLFCGAGGCTKGYQRAGFHVVGVDKFSQPNYCGDAFIQNDALAVLRCYPDWLRTFHASPPCQHYANVTRWRGNQDDHPDLLRATVDLLDETGLPYIVENVPGSPMEPDLILCGSQFGLPLRRHRWFITNPQVFRLVPRCAHDPLDLAFMHKQERAYADAMGCDWMSAVEARQAIPPAYTEWIGERLLEQIEAAA